jgi:hypothetical protein
MDNGSQDAMTLMRMPSGGFLVMQGRGGRDDYGSYSGPVFASTTIDESLKFMRDKVKPIPPQQQPAGESK